MDLQMIADSFYAPTCVISVQKTKDGDCGEIRLAAGNAKYVEPFEKPVPVDFSDKLGVPQILDKTQKFVPNSLYEKYLPKDKGFEDICFRAAVKKLPIHTYVNLNDLNMGSSLTCVEIKSQKKP